MRILIDGDACPQKDDILKIAQKYHIDMIVYVDYAHVIESDEYKVKCCTVGHDHVDMMIINDILTNDIVITQDFGLASLALMKKAKVLHVSGKILTNDNINDYLMSRYVSSHLRRGRVRLKGPSQRTNTIKSYFLKQLEELIKEEFDS